MPTVWLGRDVAWVPVERSNKDEFAIECTVPETMLTEWRARREALHEAERPIRALLDQEEQAVRERRRRRRLA